MQATSPLAQALNALLQERHGTSLTYFIRVRREGDTPRSYMKIARDLHEATGVLVSWNTVRRWVDDQAKAAS